VKGQEGKIQEGKTMRKRSQEEKRMRKKSIQDEVNQNQRYRSKLFLAYRRPEPLQASSELSRRSRLAKASAQSSRKMGLGRSRRLVLVAV